MPTPLVSWTQVRANTRPCQYSLTCELTKNARYHGEGRPFRRVLARCGLARSRGLAGLRAEGHESGRHEAGQALLDGGEILGFAQPARQPVDAPGASQGMHE